jgi:hypothetical protein
MGIINQSLIGGRKQVAALDRLLSRYGIERFPNSEVFIKGKHLEDKNPVGVRSFIILIRPIGTFRYCLVIEQEGYPPQLMVRMEDWKKRIREWQYKTGRRKPQEQVRVHPNYKERRAERTRELERKLNEET